MVDEREAQLQVREGYPVPEELPEIVAPNLIESADGEDVAPSQSGLAAAVADGGEEPPGDEGASGQMTVGPVIEVVVGEGVAVPGDDGRVIRRQVESLAVVGPELLEPGRVPREARGEDRELLLERHEIHAEKCVSAEREGCCDGPIDGALVIAERSLYPISAGERIGEVGGSAGGPAELVQADVARGGGDRKKVPEVGAAEGVVPAVPEVPVLDVDVGERRDRLEVHEDPGVSQEIRQEDLGVAENRAVIGDPDEDAGIALHVELLLPIGALLFLVEGQAQGGLEGLDLRRFLGLLSGFHHLHRLTEVHPEHPVPSLVIRGKGEHRLPAVRRDFQRREAAADDVGVLPDLPVHQAQGVNVEDALPAHVGGEIEGLPVAREGRLDVARLAERQLGQPARVGGVHHEDLLVLVDPAVEDDRFTVRRPGRIAVVEVVLGDGGHLPSLEFILENIHDSLLVSGEEERLAVGREGRGGFEIDPGNRDPIQLLPIEGVEDEEKAFVFLAGEEGDPIPFGGPGKILSALARSRDDVVVLVGESAG